MSNGVKRVGSVEGDVLDFEGSAVLQNLGVAPAVLIITRRADPPSCSRLLNLSQPLLANVPVCSLRSRAGHYATHFYARRAAVPEAIALTFTETGNVAFQERHRRVISLIQVQNMHLLFHCLVCFESDVNR